MTRDRRRRHGAVGHQGQGRRGCRSTSCSAARSRDGVMVYGHANGATIDETLAAVGRFLELGYRAVRVQCAVPGLERHLRRGRGDAVTTSRPTPRCRRRQVWSHRALPGLRAAAVRAVRDASSARPAPAARRPPPPDADRGRRASGSALEPYHLFWMEDPSPAEQQEGFRLIRQHTTTPIAVGEVFNSICDCQQLITEQLIDYIRTTVVHAGGITHLRRIFSSPSSTTCAPDRTARPTSRRSCMAAALHFDLSVPQLRHPGVHAAHAPRPTPSSRTPTLRRRPPAPRRRAGARRRHRRGRWRRGYPYEPRLPAGEPPPRRHDARLVATPRGPRCRGSRGPARTRRRRARTRSRTRGRCSGSAGDRRGPPGAGSAARAAPRRGRAR